MLVVAAPIVFESPTELTTPPEVVHRRADRRLSSLRFPTRKASPIHIIRSDARARERVDSSVLLHWSRFYTPPDAARSREAARACHTHHRVASTPAPPKALARRRGCTWCGP